MVSPDSTSSMIFPELRGYLENYMLHQAVALPFDYCVERVRADNRGEYIGKQVNATAVSMEIDMPEPDRCSLVAMVRYAPRKEAYAMSRKRRHAT